MLVLYEEGIVKQALERKQTERESLFVTRDTWRDDSRVTHKTTGFQTRDFHSLKRSMINMHDIKSYGRSIKGNWGLLILDSNQERMKRENESREEGSCMSGVPDEQQSLFQHRRYSGDKPGKKSPERLVFPQDSFWFQTHAINDIREWRTRRERKPVGLEFASSLSLQVYLKEKLEGQVSLQCQNISSWKIHTREWPFSGDRVPFIHLILNLECDYIHVLTLEMSQDNDKKQFSHICFICLCFSCT